MITKKNSLLALDVYKMGHMSQYAPGTSSVLSYFCNRSDQYFDKHIFFGLQYYLQEYLSQRITPEMGEEFLEIRKLIIGPPEKGVEEKIRNLCNLGYFPLRIKSLPEGVITTKHIPLFTIENTIPGYHWVVGFVESLLLKVWYPSVVATTSYKYKQLVNKLFEESVDESNYGLRDFMVHDFGYRGDTSEEGAALSGVAHLLSFIGSDTVPALPLAVKNYYADTNKPIMLSVPASEHSVACSFGRDEEFEYFENMLNIYPEGIVSIVSDQYDVYKVFSEYTEKLKDRILNRKGKTVFRPDSGQQELVICGDPNGKTEPEKMGCIQLLDKVFGHTINSKGYKVLHPSIGILYGDGLYYEKYEKIQRRLMSMGYSAENLIIGVGGILRNHSRDVLGSAIKAVYVEKNGIGQEIFKDPITDSNKKSLKGLLYVGQNPLGEYFVEDQVSREKEQTGCLEKVFENGKILKETSLQEIRERVSIC